MLIILLKYGNKLVTLHVIILDYRVQITDYK